MTFDDIVAQVGVHPYHQDDSGTIYCGDCFEIMKRLPDKSIDLVVTDPPYGVDYAGGQHRPVSDKLIVNEVNKHQWREKIFGDSNNLYTRLFSELHRLLILCSGGAYVFYSESRSHWVYPPIPFTHYQMLIWGKSNVKYPALNARYKHNFEPFVWLTRPPTKWRGGSKQPALWWMPRESKNIAHPTQKPLDVMRRMILNSSDPGDIVFDPFMGSGTTLVAARELGRRYIGIEIEEKYCLMAKRRLTCSLDPLL
jgi:DNA modification methylase